MKTISSCNSIEIRKILFLLFIVFFSLVSWLIVNKQSVNKGYSIFVEFDNAHGIKQGSPVRLRGLVIGSVTQISNEINSVLALVKFDSNSLLIPKNSLIETNQTGLLNDAVIDIIPLELVPYDVSVNPLSANCNDSHILCHLSYLQGDRGLNYDDLIRATTRISQRFDDPRFFNLFYMFLHNSVEITDHVTETLVDLSDFFAFYSKNYINNH
uniref:Mce/MlaD domain-containing protein n=1 Tax=Helminthora furcellata TaxID=1884666 RepID=A0A1G4NZ70_9FLOR|nr:Hypothetical protein ycf22 [Helminthora furcellata]SCW21098.1 Hypothetical protein ycf22 [Helminthora furcellata]SCW23958.1 Hypothetical protein ycf22 [Helminthora furcellata]